MELIISLNGRYPGSSLFVSNIERMIESYFLNPFFPWVALVLFLNRNKWKRPIIYILVAYWFLKSTGDLFCRLIAFLPRENDTFWPYSMYGWYIGCAMSFLFWLSSEIVGDWYYLLRIKAIISNKNLTVLYITCILYNLTKVMGIFCFFIIPPSSLSTKNNEKSKTFFTYWIVIMITIQLFNILYDLANIYYLRKNLFNKYKKNKVLMKNSFMDKLKQTSEFRIIVSMIVSFLLIPYFLMTLEKIGSLYNGIYYYLIGVDTVDVRFVTVDINYCLMFIDQILLRFYAERNNPEFKISSTNTYMFKNHFHTSHKSEKSSSTSDIYSLNISDLPPVPPLPPLPALLASIPATSSFSSWQATIPGTPDTPTILDMQESLSDSNSIKENESLKDTNSIKENESIKDTNSIKEYNSIKDTNSIKENESIKDTNSIKEYESLKDTNSIKENNSIKDTNSIKENESINEPIKDK